MPLAQNELHDHFLKAIHHLPEKSQLVFKLSRHHGYSNKEIAGHLEISEKAVEYHVSKVIKLLRAGLTLALFCLVRTLVLLLNQQP
jgi:RNA polymerase sigma-70 factor (ECF subfamily)